MALLALSKYEPGMPPNILWCMKQPSHNTTLCRLNISGAEVDKDCLKGLGHIWAGLGPRAVSTWNTSQKNDLGVFCWYWIWNEVVPSGVHAGVLIFHRFPCSWCTCSVCGALPSPWHIVTSVHASSQLSFCPLPLNQSSLRPLYLYCLVILDKSSLSNQWTTLVHGWWWYNDDDDDDDMMMMTMTINLWTLYITHTPTYF